MRESITQRLLFRLAAIGHRYYCRKVQEALDDLGGIFPTSTQATSELSGQDYSRNTGSTSEPVMPHHSL